jgi:hypothetical protein
MPLNSAEHFKHSFEYLRHITSLSAGAVALQIGFTEKLFPYPKFRALVAISIISFTGSILCSVFTQWGLLGFIGRQSRGQINEPADDRTGVFTILMWAGFILGLVAAVLFALINLFR